MPAYILPPINAEAINTTNARLGIPESAMVSSSVPEIPPGAYASGTAYALNDQVSTGTQGGVISVWRGILPGNIGHAPETSPAWWTLLGTTYSAWAAGVTWATGHRVVRAVDGVHAIFQRLAPGGVSATLPELDPTAWARVSATNRWAMFDMLSAVPTVALSPLTFTLAPGRISGIALVGGDSGNVRIQLSSGDAVLFDVIETFDSAQIADWDDYFFADFATRSNIVRLDVPTYSDGRITVTITSATGVVTLGKCIVGRAAQVGDTLASPRVRRKNFSVVDRNEYGEITGITRRKSISLVSSQFFAPKHIAIRAKAALDAARTTPCVLVGLDAGDDAYTELLTLMGICTDSDLDLRNTNHCVINAEFEGI